MELFFANDTLTEDEIKKGIAKGIVTRGMFPVLCLSAKNNIGVDRLLEFIVNEAPSITDMPAPVNNKGNEVKPNPAGPASVYVFKSAIEEHIGEINYFRVYSGKITENLDVVNSNNGTKERLSQLYVSAGKNRTRVPELHTGDIGAFVKLKNTKTVILLMFPEMTGNMKELNSLNQNTVLQLKPRAKVMMRNLVKLLTRFILKIQQLL